MSEKHNIIPPEVSANIELSRLYTVSSGKYHTISTANIVAENAVDVCMGNIGKTNATSQYPVIGTSYVVSCTAMILYNPKTKTAVIRHEAQLEPEHFKDALASVRERDDEPVKAYIVGAGTYGSAQFNHHTIAQLEPLSKVIAQAPNVQVEVFDVYDKPKPASFALDTRNGRLIRGSELVKNLDQAADAPSAFIADWKAVHKLNEMFDGTIPERQIQRRTAI
jgi:hypothetical protein